MPFFPNCIFLSFLISLPLPQTASAESDVQKKQKLVAEVHLGEYDCFPSGLDQRQSPGHFVHRSGQTETDLFTQAQHPSPCPETSTWRNTYTLPCNNGTKCTLDMTVFVHVCVCQNTRQLCKVWYYSRNLKCCLTLLKRPNYIMASWPNKAVCIMNMINTFPKNPLHMMYHMCSAPWWPPGYSCFSGSRKTFFF